MNKITQKTFQPQTSLLCLSSKKSAFKGASRQEDFVKIAELLRRLHKTTSQKPSSTSLYKLKKQ